jgi:hypothetical protein|tara:strand:+ start:164 stop:493 length:330 start_codon:yes stop_codon:yes gene_type:complete
MTNEAMLQIATGPVAALALCLLFIFFIGRWLAAHLPVWVDRHLKQIDRMVDSHNEDRQMYKESLNEVNKTLITLHGDIGELQVDVKAMREDMIRERMIESRLKDPRINQ